MSLEMEKLIMLLDVYEEQVDYEYRLIESALKDESELEEFLLNNIKVEGKTD